MQDAVLNKRKAVYEFSIGVRATHWLRAVSIVLLVGTGFTCLMSFKALFLRASL